jgi:hypothetical protein
LSTLFSLTKFCRYGPRRLDFSYNGSHQTFLFPILEAASHFDETCSPVRNDVMEK